MHQADARRLSHQLKKAGVARKWRAAVYEYAQTHTVGNSEPIELPTRTGWMCLAVGLRDDVDRVMELVPQKDDDTRRAVTDFLLTHEAFHCASVVLPALYSKRPGSGPDEFALDGLHLMREEARADQAAAEAMLSKGRAGYHATIGWRRDRLFRFLGGDLDHWSTPMLQKGPESVSESDYKALARVWPNLFKGLTHPADGSAEQADRWRAAVGEMPPSLRVGLPELVDIRAMAQQIWPHATDLRCEARIKRCDANKPSED